MKHSHISHSQPQGGLSRRRLLYAAAAGSALLSAGALTACASKPNVPEPLVQPLGQTTFAAYAADTRAWIESRRRWATDDHALELEANCPAETRPPAGTPILGGILCIHGLGDSPWSFVDQAKNLSAAGWLVRTVLLPGCGTMPEDMAAPTADDWRRVVNEQAAVLRRDLNQLGPGTDGKPRPMWLGGFSTGCNLALEAALTGRAEADGLLLFSPAFVVRTHLTFLAPLLKPFITWLREPQESLMGGQTAFRYTMVPVPGLAAFVDTMRGVDVVNEQAAVLRRDLNQLGPGTDGKPRPMWLGGFSTGCNLALEAALTGRAEADGLLLFSPAFVVRTHLTFLAPLLKPFITWLREPQESLMGGQTAFRYTMVPVPGLAAFVDTMRGVDDALKMKPFDKPAVVMLSEHDSILDAQSLIEWIPQRFTSAQSRFIWYGSRESLGKAAKDPRIIVHPDEIPSERIWSFSHMAMSFSPDNPEYGRHGRSHICTPEGEKPSYAACRRGEVDYGAWGDKRRGRIRARLTFNPYFDEQQRVIQSVMERSA